ncbi:MAG: hypothetical protein EDM05_57735 [Leptolyngbya sp. IPPAS B-1204]|nr:MAG: hypothetical protein EDM05_29245 [Leptolyngbya sp. IPPAS B-1204]
MRIRWGVLGQLIVALPSLLVVQPVWAEEEGKSSFVTGHLSLDNPEGQMTNDNGQITNDQPATTVEEWLAQIEASLVQITGVRVETSETGLEIVLETAEGELLVD